VTIVAEDTAFDTTTLDATVGETLTITYDNRDDGIAHNLHVEGASGGDSKTDIEEGPTHPDPRRQLRRRRGGRVLLRRPPPADARHGHGVAVTAPPTRTPSSPAAAGEHKARAVTPPKGRPTPKRDEGQRALAQHTSSHGRSPGILDGQLRSANLPTHQESGCDQHFCLRPRQDSNLRRTV